MTITVPSYIIRGTYAENVTFISTLPAVQGVELLFFLFDDDTKKLYEKEKEQIESYRGRLDFSVHMPDDLKIQDEDLIRCTESLSSRYILHPPTEREVEFIRLVNSFRENYGEIFFLENVIGRSFGSLLPQLGNIGICCDTGHILLEGGKPVEFLEHWGGRVGEIHLHGVEDGWDHRGFGPGETWFEELLPFLSTYNGVLHLEVFNNPDVQSILDTLEYYNLLGENAIEGISL